MGPRRPSFASPTPLRSPDVERARERERVDLARGDEKIRSCGMKRSFHLRQPESSYSRRPFPDEGFHADPAACLSHACEKDVRRTCEGVEEDHHMMNYSGIGSIINRGTPALPFKGLGRQRGPICVLLIAVWCMLSEGSYCLTLCV